MSTSSTDDQGPASGQHDDFRLTVATERQSRQITGTDTTILIMPSAYYADVDGVRALLAQPFARMLRSIAEHQATTLGELLHHADFVITRDAATVESFGNLHDCDECRAATQRALRYLREHDDELVVGQLFWSADV